MSAAEDGKLKIGVRGRRMPVEPCSMSEALIRPANGPSEFSPFGRAHSQRKRSSSSFALDELPQDPSPPLSPSVSITFNMDLNSSGEIPIIFDFLTTGTMPSKERISKMASLKPALPPLVKFSPMSAFFPMSDSTGSLNTISTEAFGAKQPGSFSSGASHENFCPNDCSTVCSPLSAGFHSKPPSPTKSVDHGTRARAYPREPIVSSTSAPAVHVLDYDIGQKELADISTFTISAYLSSPPHGDVSTQLDDSLHLRGIADGRGSQDDSTAQPVLSEIESENRILLAGLSGNANTNDLLSTPSTPDLDDKTPTQSTFRKRGTEDYFSDAMHFLSTDSEASRASKAVSELSTEEPLSSCGGFLTVPSSPDSDDKTPTQATFLKPHTDPSLRVSMPKRARGAVSSCEGNLPVPESPDYDDTTPTQTTFLQRCKNPDALSLAEPSHAAEQTDTAEISPKWTSSQTDVDARRLSLAESRDKDLPEEPTSEGTEDFMLIKSPAPNGSVAFHTSGARSVLPVPCLRHARWLRDTIVELWIDQEGFRAIRPKFFLASVSNGLPYSRESSSQDILELSEEHDPLYTTVAEFLPVSRVASYFHHAAFDRGPTLHRITTGDETNDYITRAATISLRDNGVFFVQGTEDHKIDADSHGSGGRIIRLNWRFEYFVSNRRPDGRSTQKGEKVITPLSFSCTPALLHPKRAHKVTVFHIMKKTVLPNLVAQKLEPPDLAMIETHPSAASFVSLTSLVSTATQSTKSAESRSFVKVASPQKASKALLGKIDTRNQRGSVFGAPDHNARPTPKKQPHPFAPPRLELPIRPPLTHTKHRRGSYSDTTPENYLRRQDESVSRRDPTHMTHERSRSASLLQQARGHQSAAETDNHPKGVGNTKSNPTRTSMIIGPIIPQQELMKMLDREPQSRAEQASNKPVDRRPHSIRVEVVNDMSVTTLPAPPRQRHNQ